MQRGSERLRKPEKVFCLCMAVQLVALLQLLRLHLCMQFKFPCLKLWNHRAVTNHRRKQTHYHPRTNFHKREKFGKLSVPMPVLFTFMSAGSSLNPNRPKCERKQLTPFKPQQVSRPDRFQAWAPQMQINRYQQDNRTLQSL